jgi:endonuclease III related protein
MDLLVLSSEFLVPGLAGRLVVVNQAHAKREFQSFYHALAEAWQNPHWWPAESRFEVIAGAFLTQNTAWGNVEQALARLRAEKVLSVSGIRRISRARLEVLVRPSGYFRQKAARLKGFVRFLDGRYASSLERMFARPTEELRAELLSVNGVGPETADSILLYAGQHPVFVVDAYTRRVLARHGIMDGDESYEKIRAFCEDACSGLHPSIGDGKEEAPGAHHSPSHMSMTARSPQAQVHNQMHAWLVGVGKNYCLKAEPRCDECPLRRFLPQVKTSS